MDRLGFNKLMGQCLGLHSQPLGTCGVCAALGSDMRLSGSAAGEEEPASEAPLRRPEDLDFLLIFFSL